MYYLVMKNTCIGNVHYMMQPCDAPNGWIGILLTRKRLLEGLNFKRMTYKLVS